MNKETKQSPPIGSELWTLQSQLSTIELVSRFCRIHETISRNVVKERKIYKTLFYRKFWFLVRLTAIEEDKGYFTPRDLCVILGKKEPTPAVFGYWSRLLAEGWINTIELEGARPQATDKETRGVVALVFSNVLRRVLKASLGAPQVQPGFCFDGSLLRSLRFELGMSLPTMAQELKLPASRLSRIERGLAPVSRPLNKQIFARFYHKIGRIYWPDDIRKKVKAGKVEYPKFERLDEINPFIIWSRVEAFEFERMPMIRTAQAKKAAREQAEATPPPPGSTAQTVSDLFTETE